MHINPLHLIDFYKADHRRQYPEGTSFVFSNFTARFSRMPGVDKVVFFGLQYFIKEYLIKQWNKEFFERDIQDVANKYKRLLDRSLENHGITLEHIEKLHAHGCLPLDIRALPEGARVPIGVPMLVIYNTQPWAFWLPNYIETILSATLWQACTSATIAHQFFQQLALDATFSGDYKTPIEFLGHDFSFRGMSSLETACLSGAAHLLSFNGTDTAPAIDFLEEYYSAGIVEMVGASVPATEHSVMCMHGKSEEIHSFRKMLQLYPNGIVSVVSDTWDYYGVLTNVLPQLKNEIMARNGKLVIRPDSSKKTPFEIICGDDEAPIDSPEHRGSIQILWELFGGTIVNNHKRLDSHIGLIYGDSISLELVKKINQRLRKKGFCSTNWVAGIGSYTYQHNTRDTFGFAMKSTFGVVNGEERQIYKNPKTDNGVKKSARGLVAVDLIDGEYKLRDGVSWVEMLESQFELVFSDGCELHEQSLAMIRARLRETK
jgi:nicotinamide phosphoribosyltransferase